MFSIFKKVIQWHTCYMDNPPPPEDAENKEKWTDDIPVWDQEFLKAESGTLFELILAANYLDLKGWIDVTCQTVTVSHDQGANSWGHLQDLQYKKWLHWRRGREMKEIGGAINKIPTERSGQCLLGKGTPGRITAKQRLQADSLEYSKNSQETIVAGERGRRVDEVHIY